VEAGGIGGLTKAKAVESFGRASTLYSSTTTRTNPTGCNSQNRPKGKKRKK